MTMDNLMSSGSKPVLYYNEWFVSAIRSSKVDGNIQVKKLIQNCTNCYNEVKSLVGSSELEEIRLNLTVCLLLGCSSINSLPEILDTQELMSLIKSLPDSEMDTFFLSVKGLKNNKYIRSIFPWLPSEIVGEFLSCFLSQSIKLTPLSLALCFEMFYSFMYSLQYDTCTSETVSNNIEKYAKFLQSHEKVVVDQPNSKLLAYYFMYTLESIFVLLQYLNCKSVKEPYTCSLGLKFKALKMGSFIPDKIHYKLCIEKSLPLLTDILNNLVGCISLEIWISWHDLKAPNFTMLSNEKIDDDDDDEGEDKIEENTIQTQIAHTTFRIMTMQNEILSFNECMNFGANKELEIFLKQISIDPDYDSDNDLCILELIEAIKESSSKKRKKLISLLLKKLDIFESKESLSCLKENISFVSRNTALLFIKDFIKLDKEIMDIEEWKWVVIELSKCIKNDDVTSILKEELNYGHSDVLKTKNFTSDFTQICNQLSREADTECLNSYLRLCLQSGIDVVKYSIEMALSMSGLSTVIASAFRTINYICRSKDENGLCLTTNLLIEKLEDELPLEMENRFFDLILELLEKPGDSFSSVCTESLNSSFSFHCLSVDISEIFEHLICARLKMKSEDDANMCLLNILKILEKIVNFHSDIVLKSPVRLSCIASLIIIHNNCSYVHDSNYNICLKIRNYIDEIIFSLKKLMVKDMCCYEEDFALLKIFLSRYELHCRSILLISKFMGNQTISSANSVVDQIFNCIWKKSYNEENFSFPNCSKIEWIWALYIILPSSNESEWLSALLVSHSYLYQGDSNLVTPTLKLLRESLLLMCDCANQTESSIPLQHCFKSFSNAAITFVDEKLENERNKFVIFTNIFIWWCKAQRVFDCNPEYPVLFLNLIVSRLIGLITENHLMVNNNSEDTSGLHLESTTSSKVSTNVVNHDSLDNNVDEVETCNNVGEINGEEYSNSTFLQNRNSSIKVMSKSEFNDVLESMIKTFVCYIRPAELTSAVAGKLKTLCEM